MNNETEVKKIPRTVPNPGLLNGTWRLKYKLINRLGEAGFSGRMLSSYTDLITGAPRHYYNEHGQMEAGFFIDRQVMIFEPEKNPIHRNIVDFLLGHPEVSIQGEQIKASEAFMAKKDKNPRITLVNLDYEAIEEMDDEETIDALVGQITLTKGTHALGFDKLCFVLSYLNLSYRDEKYIKDKVQQTKRLRKRLKDHVKKSVENAIEVQKVLEKLDEAKYIYEIKEMVRLGILYVSNGMYKYQSNPLGISVESVIKRFRDEPDFYTDLHRQLTEALKASRGY